MDADEMDEMWYKEKKMDEDDIEELTDVIVSVVAALCQAKEKKEKTRSKVWKKSSWIELVW